MRVDAFNQISQIYGANGKLKTNAATKTAKSDKVEISNFGKELQIAKMAVKNSPDIREGLVSDIKNQIDNGTYEVDDDSFADRLMEKFGLM